MEEQVFEATKLASIQIQKDHEARVQEIAVEARSSISADTTRISSSTNPMQDPFVSALVTTSASVAKSVPTVVGIAYVKDGTRSEVPCAKQMAPRVPRYIFAPYFVFLDVLGIVQRYLVGGGGCTTYPQRVIVIMFLFSSAAVSMQNQYIFCVCCVLCDV